MDKIRESISRQKETSLSSCRRAASSLCGSTLAHAHARCGKPAKISGYFGKSDKFDRAVADFSIAYANQSERKVLMKAVKDRKLEVIIERE